MNEMRKQQFTEAHTWVRAELDRCVNFWLKNGMDPEFGGDEDGRKRDDGHDDQAHERDLVPAQALDAVLEERGGRAHLDDVGLFLVGGGNEVIHVDMEGESVFLIHVRASLVQFDPRVDDLVQKVGHEVHNNNETGQNDGRAHDERVITAGDAVDERAADACAVFTEQGVDLTLFELQGDVVVGDDTGETFCDVEHLDRVLRFQVFRPPSVFMARACEDGNHFIHYTIFVRIKQKVFRFSRFFWKSVQKKCAGRSLHTF